MDDSELFEKIINKLKPLNANQFNITHIISNINNNFVTPSSGGSLPLSPLNVGSIINNNNNHSISTSNSPLHSLTSNNFTASANPLANTSLHGSSTNDNSLFANSPFQSSSHVSNGIIGSPIMSTQNVVPYIGSQKKNQSIPSNLTIKKPTQQQAQQSPIQIPVPNISKKPTVSSTPLINIPQPITSTLSSSPSRANSPSIPTLPHHYFDFNQKQIEDIYYCFNEFIQRVQNKSINITQDHEQYLIKLCQLLPLDVNYHKLTTQYQQHLNTTGNLNISSPVGNLIGVGGSIGSAGSPINSNSIPNLIHLPIKLCQLIVLMTRNNQISFQDHPNDLDYLLNFLLNNIQYQKITTAPITTAPTVLLLPGVPSSTPTTTTPMNSSGGSSSNSSNTPSQSNVNISVGLRIDSLRAISSILFNNGPYLSCKIHQPLIEKLLDISNYSNPYIDTESKRLATIALGNMSVQCGNKLSKFYHPIFERLTSNIEKITNQLVTNDRFQIKFTCSTLRSLQLVAAQTKGIIEHKPQSLYNILKKLMFFGINLSSSISSVLIYQYQFDSLSDYDDDGDNEDSGGLIMGGNQSRHARGDKKIDTGLNSDGEIYDERYSLSKVRYLSLNLLTTLVKNSPKVFFGYWSLFLPSSPFPLTPSVFTSIIHDPDLKVKVASINFLHSIIDGSKDFLVAVQSTKESLNRSPTPYTSFSQNLSTILKEIHNGLILILNQETISSSFRVHILRCITTLISNCPYERLNSGLISHLFTSISPYLRGDQEQSIQLVSLTCIKLMLETTTPTPFELTPILLQPTSQTIINEILDIPLKPDQIPDSIRLESIQIFGALSKYNFEIFDRVYEKIYNVLYSLITRTEPPISEQIKIQTLKTYEEISKSIRDTAGNNNDKKKPSSEREFWKLFFKVLNSLVLDQVPHIRSAICNCLSNISSTEFANLQTHSQLHCISVIIGLISDESQLVRASACRAIGILIKLDSLCDDASFLSKSALCLTKSMNDTNIHVKIKACWSLANLCDHLVTLKSNDEIFNDIPNQILLTVLEILLVSSFDNPKIRSNAVRALGNFARFASKELLYKVVHTQNNPNNLNILERIIDSLLKNASDPSTSFNFVKVKWNACYALGNIFYNEDIDFTPNPVTDKWLSQVYSTLINLVKTCKNYKTRINATTSLASVTHNRVKYSKYYRMILECILDSLRNINSIADTSEFQYKDNLEKQSEIAIIHLLSEMNPDEIDQYKSLLLDFSHEIYNAFSKHAPYDNPNSNNNNNNNNNNTSNSSIENDENEKEESSSSLHSQQTNRPTLNEYTNSIEILKIFVNKENTESQSNNEIIFKISQLKLLFDQTKDEIQNIFSKLNTMSLQPSTTSK